MLYGGTDMNTDSFILEDATIKELRSATAGTIKKIKNTFPPECFDLFCCFEEQINAIHSMELKKILGMSNGMSR